VRAKGLQHSPDSERSVAIDRFRGTLVVLMVVGDYLSGVNFVPDFLKHAPDIGFTIADTVAPAFIFIIGLNFGPSFERRRNLQGAYDYSYFAFRYLSLIGIGAVIAGAATMVGQPTDWGVLQAIGVAGLLTLLVIRLPSWARFGIGAVMLIGYQLLVDSVLLDEVLPAVHGGFFGAISWGALLILSTAVADTWRKGFMPYLACLLVIGALSVASSYIFPVSKHRVSLSFDLITLALSACVFLVFEGFSRVVANRAGIFSWWGESALVLYLIHLVLLGIFVSLPTPWWYEEAPMWLCTIELVAMLTAMSLIARWMHIRRNRI
jgi:predicted acyltransferase